MRKDLLGMPGAATILRRSGACRITRCAWTIRES